MAQAGLMWIGVASCLGALLVNLFPALTYELGMDRGGAWQMFAFGVFLILLSAFLTARRGNGAGEPGK